MSSQPETIAEHDTTAAGQIDLLHGLVAIPSLSGEERAAVTYLVQEMSARGLDAHIDAAGNAIGVKGNGPTRIVLLGHIDTVPGDIPVRVDDGVLHGRGSVDAKGPLATFVAAAEQASGQNATITVVGAVGEESIGSPGAHHAATWPAPDLCIIGEPSSWDAVCLGYRGTISFTYRLVQAGRHTAGPGETVGELGVQFWNLLLAEIQRLNGDSEGFHSIGTSLRSINTSTDGLYDTVEMSIGIRIPPAVPSARVLEIIDGLRDRAEIELHGVQEGYSTNKRNPMTAPFLRAIRAEGGNPRFTRKLGTADMTVVGPVWQCPIVAYGPGDAALDHTPEERIDLDDYVRAVRVLTAVLDAV
ncbi:MAG: [LysW]-lysine hydrolase [Thermomicrobiales bacterium]|nr:[LysW]-lysine hydrolase [Thermomicrobiales bacterium]